MKFNTLSIKQQLITALQLSGLKYYVSGFAGHSASAQRLTNDTSSERIKELEKHGITKIDEYYSINLTTSIGQNYFSVPSFHGNHNQIINLNRVSVNQSISDDSISLSVTTEVDGIDGIGDITSKATMSCTFTLKDDVEAQLNRVKEALVKQGGGDEVTKILEDLQEGYRKAKALPDDVLTTISNLNNMARVFKSVIDAMTSNGIQYDDEGREYNVPPIAVNHDYNYSGFSIRYTNASPVNSRLVLNIKFGQTLGEAESHVALIAMYPNNRETKLTNVVIEKTLSAAEFVDELIKIANKAEKQSTTVKNLSGLTQYLVSALEECKEFIDIPVNTAVPLTGFGMNNRPFGF